MRKPRLFIIEGPDCSGKSALARFICNRLNAAYIHSTWTPALTGVAQLDYLESLLRSAHVSLSVSGLDVVLDRHWPSECCYSFVFRKGYDFEHAERLGKLMAECRDRKAIYIYCKGDYQRYKASSEKDHTATPEQYSALLEEYKNHANATFAMGNIVHDYDLVQYGAALDDYLASLNINQA